VRVKATTRRVDDGVWHEATLRRNGKEGRVTVDGTAADFSTPGTRRRLQCGPNASLSQWENSANKNTFNEPEGLGRRCFVAIKYLLGIAHCRNFS
jgi:hypothetical protein